MNIKHIMVVILCAAIGMPMAAQELPPTLPPNYRLIKKVTRNQSSPYFYDSLLARFSRCDTTLTIDDVRCLYYGGDEAGISDCYRRYRLLLGRLGRHQGRANDVWWQYQMLQSAVWSTGDGSEEHPLHVRDLDDIMLLRSLDNPDDTTSPQTFRRRRLVYVAYNLPDGSRRWCCYRKR